MSRHYPKTVPVFSAKDMCIGPYSVSPQCGCMRYWRDSLFGSDHELRPLVFRALVSTEDEMNMPGTTAWWNEPGHFLSETIVTKSRAAQFMNRMLARMGYVRGNPECDRQGNLIPMRKR